MRFLRRYSSTIYGQYRIFGVRAGLITGAAMAVAMILARLAGEQAQPSAPENYITDAVMLVGMLFFAYRYRQTLPDSRVTIKELMLLGLWIGFVASALYGLLLWAYCAIDTGVVTRFAEARLSIMSASGDAARVARDTALVQSYTAADWGFIGGFRSVVMSILMNFVAALVFRTEKAPLRNKC